MKNLINIVNESLKNDVNNANKLLKKITRFKGDVDKLAKKDTENLFGASLKEINKLIDSAIESINFSIIGAVNESVNRQFKHELTTLYRNSKKLLDELNSLDDKNTSLTSDLVDAIVDFGDAVDMLKELNKSVK